MGIGETMADATFFILWWIQLIFAVYLIWRVLYKRSPFLALAVCTAGLAAFAIAAHVPVAEEVANHYAYIFTHPFDPYEVVTFFLALVCATAVTGRDAVLPSQTASLRDAWLLFMVVARIAVLTALFFIVLIFLVDEVTMRFYYM